MKLSEFHLPCILLPNNPDNSGCDNRRKLSENTSEIKSLLKDMKENEHRTTNFATILYLEENNYEKISMDSIKVKMLKDFNLNKNLFVNSRNNTPFESERNLIQSLHISIARNKSFITEIINKKKFVSLNKPKAIEYLKKMYEKYTSNYNGDITSLASIDSKRTKIDFDDNSNNNRSERKRKPKNLIGNKTHRSYNTSKNNNLKYGEISSYNDEHIIYSNYKYLRDNLQEIKPTNNNKRKNRKKESNNNNLDKKLKYEHFLDEKNKIGTLSTQEIDVALDALNETQTIISSYKNKLNKIKSQVDEKEKKYKDFQNTKLNVNSTKKELNILYDIVSIKLGIIQSTKKHKYYGSVFTKSKQIILSYKYIFDNKINDIQKNITHMNIIETDIFNKHSEIMEEMQDIHQTDNGFSYLSKNEIKKDVNNMIKKVKYEKKIIGNLNRNYLDGDNNFELIEDIINKFNDIAQEISQEKEDFE